MRYWFRADSSVREVLGRQQLQIPLNLGAPGCHGKSPRWHSQGVFTFDGRKFGVASWTKADLRMPGKQVSGVPVPRSLADVAGPSRPHRPDLSGRNAFFDVHIALLQKNKQKNQVPIIYKLVISHKTPGFWFSLIWPHWGPLSQPWATLGAF